MAVMTHIGDPDTWYHGKYADASVWGSREEHYQMWENVMQANPAVPWVGAHMGGNPENLARLQDLLDRYPLLNLDIGATKWMVRKIAPGAMRLENFSCASRSPDLRIGSGQRRRSTLRFSRQPMVGPPQALGNRLHRSESYLRSRSARRCPTYFTGVGFTYRSAPEDLP